MKLWLKALLVLIVILALLFSAAYIFFLFKGKAIITNNLEGLTQKKINIGHISLSPPLTIKIKKLDIEGLIKVDSVYISPSILGLFTGKLALNDIKIIKPELTFTYEKKQSMAKGLPASASLPGTAAKPDRKAPLRLIFKHIRIKDGRLNFVDRSVSEEGIKITLKDINFNLDNLYVFPRSVITNFELAARIPWGEGSGEGNIKASGWLNFFKKDMEATLKVEDIDGIYLYPYYANWVDLEKARIEKAKLNFSSNIHGINNQVTADCHLELADIVRKPRPPEELEEKAEKITNAVLDIFKALNQGKIVLNFTIKTTMDRPEFGFGNVKMAFENKIAEGIKADRFKAEDVIMLPGKILEGTLKTATDLAKTVIIGTVSVGNEIKKAVEAAFRKEKKEK